MEMLKKYIQNKECFLKENGIWYMAGFPVYWWMYAGFRLGLSVFFVIFARILFGIARIWLLLIFTGVFMGVDFLVKLSNENDNDSMLADIKTVFDCLRIQVKAGVYISDAISEIVPVIASKRLRQGLIYLGESIVLTNNLEESLIAFNEMFHNRHIDTLVIILRQALVSGQSAQSLDNAFAQMTDIEQALNIKTENSLERKVMVIQVMVLFGILIMAGFCCISEFAGLFESVK